MPTLTNRICDLRCEFAFAYMHMEPRRIVDLRNRIDSSRTLNEMPTKTINMKNDLKWNNAAGQHLCWFKAKQSERAKASKGASLVIAIKSSCDSFCLFYSFFLVYFCLSFLLQFFSLFFTTFFFIFLLFTLSIYWLIWYFIHYFILYYNFNWIYHRKWLNSTHDY